jgi:hypothetical protein
MFGMTEDNFSALFPTPPKLNLEELFGSNAETASNKV